MWGRGQQVSGGRQRRGRGCIQARVMVGAPLALLAVLALAACAPAPGSSRGGQGTIAAAPTSTPTRQERYALIARQALGSDARRTDATYDAASGTLTVTATLGGDVPISPADINAAHERTKSLCFRAQRALWTSDPGLRGLQVVVQGPTFDDYGDPYLAQYGAAGVTAETAGRLAWSSLTADSAWSAYDSAWLRPAYEPNWIYGKPNDATPTP